MEDHGGPEQYIAGGMGPGGPSAPEWGEEDGWWQTTPTSTCKPTAAVNVKNQEPCFNLQRGPLCSFGANE